jgi:hypothetical protein
VSLLPFVFLALAAGPSAKHFDVAASFVAPAKPGAAGAISVLFSPTDPDVAINEDPAPRLKLDPEQAVLVDKPAPSTPPARAPSADAEKARYLDLAKPVRFPVALAAKLTGGEHPVKATIVYFYCSKREGWCRRGTADVEFTVDVP